MQIQLQMISPINYNLNGQNEKVIMSSEAKAKMYKPNVLISLPKSDDLNKLSPKTSMFNKFFGGKEKQDSNESTLILEDKNSTTTSPTSSTIDDSKLIINDLHLLRNTTFSFSVNTLKSEYIET